MKKGTFVVLFVVALALCGLQGCGSSDSSASSGSSNFLPRVGM